MASILSDSSQYHANKKGSSPFEPHVIHVDTHLGSVSSPAETMLAKYRVKFPHISFECVHLTKALQLKTVDWSLLPLPESGTPAERLRALFDALPSMTSRADILRMLVRHVLVDAAITKEYSTLLLGHSTTALAALTLAEVANGRGFSVPSQVNDGAMAVCTYEGGKETSRRDFPVYYPLREVLKNELLKYMELVPALNDMIPEAKAGAVVSHKDVSIEEVMQRYFEGVEGPYAGIVTNVVRTTGKLEPLNGQEKCRLCSMSLDNKGDARWAGDMGDGSDEGAGKKLCYGCKRSVRG